MVRSDTLATRTTTRYGHLQNGHKASVVKIELFVCHILTWTGIYMIDHYNGDVYLWDRESNTMNHWPSRHVLPPLSVDTVKMLCPDTTANAQ